ncbi:MAG TPA: hypothetical protein VLE22_19475 [Bryobacteraceae bacterium]|nr:hypothetical protein [Bryobacteraceae bacterium]
MPVTVKPVTLWRKEIENKPGTLAVALEPLAMAGADLQVIMGYRFPGRSDAAALELFPVKGKKATAAAQAGGLSASTIPTLLVQGDNKAGLGYTIATSIAGAGINIGFVIAQVVGRKYSAVIGFDTSDDAKMAAILIKKAAASKKK